MPDYRGNLYDTSRAGYKKSVDRLVDDLTIKPHTPSTEERDNHALRVLRNRLHPLLLDKMGLHLAKMPGFDEVLVELSKDLLIWNQSTAKASEAALVDKLRPLLVDEPTDGVSYHTSDVRSHQNALRAELRQALGINLDQEREDG